MDPLKFVEASAINAVQMERVELKAPACQSCLRSFQDNMQLIIGLSAVPAWSSRITGQWAEACTTSENAVFGTHSGAGLNNATSDELLGYQAEINKRMHKIVERDRSNTREDLEFSTRMLEQIVVNCDPFIHKMFEGILKSLCVQAWTAIEVLIEDLHASAIRTNRDYFSSSVLEKHDNWASDRKGAFGFRSRPRFQQAYEQAFGDDAIDSILKDQSLEALAAVRNLIVHRSAIVDTRFITHEVGKAAPQLALIFPSIKVDHPLVFDGERVQSILDGAIDQGYKLIREVDRWLWSKFCATLPERDQEIQQPLA